MIIHTDDDAMAIWLAAALILAGRKPAEFDDDMRKAASAAVDQAEALNAEIDRRFADRQPTRTKRKPRGAERVNGAG